jgi:hypothetical protein
VFTSVNYYQEAAYDQDLIKVYEWAMDHAQSNEFFIVEVPVTSLVLATGRPVITRDTIHRLESTAFREKVAEMGVVNATSCYNISYLITTHQAPRYDVYAGWFAELDSSGHRRQDKIFQHLEETPFFQDTQQRMDLIQQHNITALFSLEEQFGQYKIYRIGS